MPPGGGEGTQIGFGLGLGPLGVGPGLGELRRRGERRLELRRRLVRRRLELRRRLLRRRPAVRRRPPEVRRRGDRRRPGDGAGPAPPPPGGTPPRRREGSGRATEVSPPGWDRNFWKIDGNLSMSLLTRLRQPVNFELRPEPDSVWHLAKISRGSHLPLPVPEHWK